MTIKKSRYRICLTRAAHRGERSHPLREVASKWRARLQPNYSSYKRKLHYVFRISLSLTAVYIVYFLRSETTILSTPESVNTLFFLLSFLVFLFIVVYRILLSKGKKSFFLFMLILLLIFIFCALFRCFIFERILALLGVTTALSTLILKVSSGSNESGNSGGETSIPALESSSSSESLATFRGVIAAENEAEIYARIRNMENLDFYNLPPQNRPGEYEGLVRQHFDQALNVPHFRQIMDMEYLELTVLERKAVLQDRLFNLMISEQNIDRIMELSPYTHIRKEAYDFIHNKVEPLNSLQHSFQRNLMDGSLNSFIKELNQHGRQSNFYQEFYRDFTDEDFRRAIGLPLP